MPSYSRITARVDAAEQDPEPRSDDVGYSPVLGLFKLPLADPPHRNTYRQLVPQHSALSASFASLATSETGSASGASSMFHVEHQGAEPSHRAPMLRPKALVRHRARTESAGT